MKKIFAVGVTLLIAFQVYAQTRDYTSLQSLLVKFYGYQRAGLKTGSCYNLNSGFTDGSHKGDAYNSNSLDGGWYDAGDYIKFGVNLGYSVYCLEKAYDVFPTGFDNKTDWTYKSTDAIPDILNEIKFATDYMMKAVIDANTIVLDVGNAQSEHDRDGFSIPNISGRSGSEIHLCTGADVPATYAACLALMSTLYRNYDAAYAAQCLAKAKIAFTFAKTKIAAGGDANLFCKAQSGNDGNFYDYKMTDGKYDIPRKIEDKMVAAGVELYRATKDSSNPNGADPIYKTWAKTTITDQFNTMGYAYIGPLAAFEVWRQGLSTSSGVLNSNIGFISGKVQTTGPFAKVFQNTDWGTARDAGTAAFEFALGYVATADSALRAKYKLNAANHIDWVAGYIGARSYICGVNGGPTNIHYRTSSRKAIPGAVVTGPDDQGNWSDDGKPEHCEVALDYNAGIIGAVAFMRALANPGDNVQVTSAFSASQKTPVDFNKNSLTLKATFSASVAWTIVVSGSSGKKTFTGTGTSASGVWDGTSDKGYFVGGEDVSVSITIDKTIIAYDILKATPLTVTVAQIKKSPSKTEDKLIDDFEDKDTTNKVSGIWSPIGTKTGPIAGTTLSFTPDSGSQVMAVSGSVSTSDNKNYAGVKTTFNADGKAGTIGATKSVLFDLMASKLVNNSAVNVYVELEQPSITDKAYWSAVVPVTTTMNRYRVNIADFKQPEWKTADKALDLNNISALRFTVYDSTGSIKLFLDNVYLESYSSRVVATASRLSHPTLKPGISKGAFNYSIPQDYSGILNVAVFNMAGKEVMKQSLNASAGKAISISLSNLPAGMYSVRNSVNGKVLGNTLKFMHTR